MRCDIKTGDYWSYGKSVFQSLLGFLMRCDMPLIFDALTACTFQSLLGFLMRCDLPMLAMFHLAGRSFNPCWVF